MGYACPVCGDPQADAEHLANHLAFTALRGESDHKSWLEDHAPDWDQQDAESLATTVVDHAEEVEFPQVFEDTTDQGHGHDHDGERSGALFDDESDLPEGGREAVERERRNRELDAQAEQALEDAREMTRQMMADAADDDPDSDDETDGESDDEQAAEDASN